MGISWPPLRMNLSEAFAAFLPAIETEMRDVLATPMPEVARHYAIMQYHMGWLDTELAPAQAPGGKRVRPMLCMLACLAAGGNPRGAVSAAAGLELLHNFSLIHDDIEDNSPLRRHRPTAWHLFGLPVALNAGDAMFSLSHAALMRLPGCGAPPEVALEALATFNRTCIALTEGQFLDMSFESRLDVSVSEYFAMIAGKTGALLAASSEIGALVGGAPAGVVSAYRQFGAALGRAFQLQDDVLGIWGDERVTGKSAASDILSKKKSLPIVFSLASPASGGELRARYAGRAFVAEDMPDILALLDGAGARAFTERHIAEAMAEARSALGLARAGGAPGPDAALYGLLDMLMGRQA